MISLLGFIDPSMCSSRLIKQLLTLFFRYLVDGNARYMAVTQFEPVDARRAFPCWDDPQFKAVFQLSVTAPKDRVAISNMPVINILCLQKRSLVIFDKMYIQQKRETKLYPQKRKTGVIRFDNT